VRELPIRLGQLLKLAGLAGSGSDARGMLEAGLVTVNGEPEHRRGRQVHEGDEVTVEDLETIRVVPEP
jgi:ribosome-associated protein